MIQNGLKIEEIVEKYLKRVYGFIFRLISHREEAEDIAQEVFVKIWKNLAKYDSRQNFEAWLFTITRNTVIDWSRKKKPILFSELKKDWGETEKDHDFASNIPDLEALPEELFARKELTEQLNQALEKLPANRREIVLLHLENDFSFEEIAKIVGQPMNTVKSQYRRSLLLLRQYLDAPK